MSAVVEFTRDEARLSREAAFVRQDAAKAEARRWALTIASRDVQHAFLGRPMNVTSAAILGDFLIVARAAEHEAWADWQDARVRCGLEAMSP